MDKSTLLEIKEVINKNYLKIRNDINKSNDNVSNMFHKIESNGLVIAMNIIQEEYNNLK